MTEELDLAAMIEEVDSEVEGLQEKYDSLKKRVVGMSQRSVKEIRSFQEEVNDLLAITSVSLFQLKLVNWKLYLHQRVLYGDSVAVRRTVVTLRDEIRLVS